MHSSTTARRDGQHGLRFLTALAKMYKRATSRKGTISTIMNVCVCILCLLVLYCGKQHVEAHISGDLYLLLSLREQHCRLTLLSNPSDYSITWAMNIWALSFQSTTPYRFVSNKSSFKIKYGLRTHEIAAFQLFFAAQHCCCYASSCFCSHLCHSAFGMYALVYTRNSKTCYAHAQAC